MATPRLLSSRLTTKQPIYEHVYSFGRLIDTRYISSNYQLLHVDTMNLARHSRLTLFPAK